jgi:hypothetical protein
MDGLRTTALGEFPFDGRIWTVEVHADAEIWVVHDGAAAAKMLIGSHAELGPPLPVLFPAAWDWLGQLHKHVGAVVEEAGRRGEGPWADRYAHVWD